MPCENVMPSTISRILQRDVQGRREQKRPVSCGFRNRSGEVPCHERLLSMQGVHRHDAELLGSRHALSVEHFLIGRAKSLNGSLVADIFFVGQEIGDSRLRALEHFAASEAGCKTCDLAM